jgi:predicted transglutaminase-like cysteine proteinase
MLHIRRCIFIVALAVAASSVGSKDADMPTGRRTDAPPGMLSYCLRVPAECTPPTPADDAESIRLAEEWTMKMAPRARARAMRAQRVSLTTEPTPAASTYTADAAPPPATTVAMTDELRVQLRDVNARVNRAITSSSDIKAYGVVEYWATPLSSGLANPQGDCEDYVLEKRKALLAEGLPARALSIAVAMTPSNILHVVLLVSTDRGELVLDSLTPWIVSWDNTGYRWIKREKDGAALDWISLAVEKG